MAAPTLYQQLEAAGARWDDLRPRVRDLVQEMVEVGDEMCRLFEMLSKQGPDNLTIPHVVLADLRRSIDGLRRLLQSFGH